MPLTPERIAELRDKAERSTLVGFTVPVRELLELLDQAQAANGSLPNTHGPVVEAARALIKGVRSSEAVFEQLWIDLEDAVKEEA